MNRARKEANRYLTPRPNSFWRWDEQGTVVVWRHGATIAFREELALILEPFVPDGLPPMNSLLLLLTAARTGGELTAEWLNHLQRTIPASAGMKWLERLQREFVRLGQLDAVHRNSLAARQFLVRTMFEGIEWHDLVQISEQAASEVIQLLREGIGEEVYGRVPAASAGRAEDVYGTMQLQMELSGLAWVMSRLDEQKLELLRRTGLEDVVQPAPDVEVPSDAVRHLLNSLRGDAELGALARLAREVMAAVTLPRRVSEHEDLPLGGISDLSNRGTLDRLLLSELAHDDMTLSARLAAGEALYLRRESPPKTPTQNRIVVVESGIRAWGVPRVFATSVAMALAATSDPRTGVHVFRAQGSELVPLDVTRRETLIEHLETLHLDLHPGGALPALSTRFGDRKREAELLLVTTEEAAGDAEFRQSTLQLDWPDVLLATVDREGRFRLRRVTGKGYVPLREARMRLDDLWAGGGKPQVPLVDTKASESLPAILNVVPFPLLLPHHLMSERMWSAGWLGVLALTRDKRLTMWNGREYAGRQLSQEMPSGNLLWCSPAPVKERSSAIVGTAGGGQLCLIHVHLSREECERIPIRSALPTLRAATVHGDTIFLIGKRRIIFRHLDNGEAFDAWQLPPDFSWRCGRFVQGANREWWMLNSGMGSGERLRRVTFGTDTSNAMGRRFVEFAELPREEGPVGMTTDGDLFFFRENRMLWLSKGHYLPPPVRLLATARDGTRLILGSTYKRSQRVARITLETGACEMLHGYPPALANQHLLDNLRSCSLRHRFQAIGVTDSEIHLRGRKGDRRCIRLHDEHGLLELGPSDKGDIDVRFELLTVPNVGFRLAAARWPDGSRIFLDSRGMLHLKSSDRTIPEVSIVLCEGALSGWCSDGRLWGRKYFIGDTPPALDRDIYHSSIRPFLQRLPSPCPR